ncbi:MAG: long-chain-fatty-acid--CoA ligase [Acetobacteraceae bacterium]|nr:long-chain-fatty-acid--CoA ligase [Acetobacteraceae bacterium]
MTQIAQFVRRAVQTGANKPATVFGDRTRTWRDFDGRMRRLASAMHGLGFKPGERIGILALNSDRYLESLFGLSHGGFVFVPINTRLAPPEIVFWLTDSGCSALFVDDAFVPMLPKVLPETPDVKRVIYMGDGAAPDGMLDHEALIASAQPLADSIGSDRELAGIFYTGGTTGRSKGVMLTHDNIMANALNIYPGTQANEDSRYVHAAPMFHLADNAMTFVVTGFGGTHYFLPRFDPAGLMQTIATHQITLMLIVPTMINMMVHHPDVAKYDLSSVRRLLFGASPMPEAVLRRATAVMPTTEFVQAYGQSEASPLLTLLDPRYNTFEGPNAAKVKSAGQSGLGIEVRIHDADDNEVPRGTVGEICARGQVVMLGYWKQPELTAHTLRNGWLHTGDGGYMDEEGFVYLVDRVKDMIVSGGENVYSAETEDALYGHPAVAECAVIGVPDETWGERVHAIVRLKPGMSATAEDLIAHTHTRIANYKCPRSVDFREEPLPLSGAGKILKTELRKPFWVGKEKQIN